MGSEVVGTAAPQISVILAIYNERGHVVREVERIKSSLDLSGYTYEVIAVDDGSTDGTWEELQTLEGLRTIRLRQNRGSGSARRIGSRAARGEVVVWTDVDMTYPNDEIPRLVKELEGFDQVVGARRSEEGTHRRLRFTAKWLIRRLASYLLRTPIPDLNSGFRAFRNNVGVQFYHLLPPGFSCVSTMTMSFLANGYSVKHIPIDYFPRVGESKFHWWKDTKRYFAQVVRMTLSYEPLRVFAPLGDTLTVAATAKLVFDWVQRDFHLSTNTLLLFFAAFQILAIGLLADLIVRMAKPHDHVDSASL